MDYYGDESGQFQALLSGEDQCISHAVVEASNGEVMSCSKRVVRDISDIPEAKWNSLREQDKRRFLECLSGRESVIRAATVTVTKSDLESLDASYLLYGDRLPYLPSIVYGGVAYGVLLAKLDIKSDPRPTFKFDRFYSQKQSQKLIDVAESVCKIDEISSRNSRKVQGIQTADCVAGASREDRCKGTDWMTDLSNSMHVDASDYVLSTLEKFLHEQSTGP